MDLVIGKLGLEQMPTLLNNFRVTDCHIENPTPKKITLSIHIERLPGNFVLSLFIPSICLIMAAEITLFIDERHFKATITVALTSNLVMYTLYRSIQEKLPEDSKPKLIDIWLMHGLLMPMVVFIILASRTIWQEFVKELEDLPQQKLSRVSDSSWIFTKDQISNMNESVRQNNKRKIRLGCQLIVPAFSIVFIITFFFVICQNR